MVDERLAAGLKNKKILYICIYMKELITERDKKKKPTEAERKREDLEMQHTNEHTATINPFFFLLLSLPVIFSAGLSGRSCMNARIAVWGAVGILSCG